MSTPTGAVFLSYASQDAEAVRLICTALRAAGIEVWLDQSELRGGDAWDRSIREQIRNCRLFIPVVSANTEGRDEGYFRREWALAVDRTRDITHKRAFLVPVVIDGTSADQASVPEKFHELQWTRLPGGETPPAFVERVRQLLAPHGEAAAAVPPPSASRGADVAADGAVPEAVSYRCGDFHVDTANRRFTCRGVEVALEPRTFAVILQLLARPNQLVTRNQLLDAVWGHRYVTPSTLNRVIALARRAFGDDTAEPRFILTVHGAGYRYTGPCERDEPASAARAVRFGPPPAARLPARVDALIGREQDLGTLSSLVAAHRAVTVLGPGGIGKTQFALELARRLAPQFPDGVWFFDLVPLAQGAEWLRALGAALGIPSADDCKLMEHILPVLQDRRALLVLDNCDRVAAEVGALVIQVLRGTESLNVLSTSQAPLNFTGEQLLRLAPLALPAGDPAHSSLAEIAAVPAVEMLVTRARAVQPGFQLTASNAATVVEICRRLDGMPLALELAAARFALLSPEQVLQRLDQRFQFLRGAVAGRDGRHQNLRLLLEWSFSLLSAQEQQLLRWLGVFVQGWTMESAIELAAVLGHAPEMAVDLLTGLVAKSLVAVTPGLVPPRYRLLETVREYALEQLRASAEEPRARRAHVDLMVRMAEAAHVDMVGGMMTGRIEQLVREQANINAAVDHALGAGADPSAALRIAGGLLLFAKARTTSIAGLQRMLEATRGSTARERARALLCWGVMVVHFAHSGDDLLEAARLARAHNDLWAEAYANGYYAMTLSNHGRPAEAPPHVAVVERIAAELSDPILQGLAGLARGWILMGTHDYRAALETLRAVRRLGPDVHQHHFIDMYIALSLYFLDEDSAAAIQFLDALNEAAAVLTLRGMAGSMEGCGYLAIRREEWADAARFLAAAAGIRERTGVPLFNFWVPAHEAAHASLRAKLGAAGYEAQSQAGRRMRDEDAANEVRARLQLYGAGAANIAAGS
ncbi:MAG TPA: TIR domain-containing protein [Steroidobacteraceae bacterium]|nr:TIR domain-containing protein [Steroidobacteraceae bacterium]